MQAGGTPRSGRRIGNIRVPVGRRRARVFEVPTPVRRRPERPTTLYLVGGFLGLIAVGTLLLLLPFSTDSGDSPSFTTALFTATSAVCVTGLAVVETHDHWSFFGEVVIVVLIQLGGLGFMTSSTLLVILAGRRLSLGQRMLAGRTLGRERGLIVGDLIRDLVRWTLMVEGVGIVVLIAAMSLSDRYDFGWEAIWAGTFTAISAFNNAGFDIAGGGTSLREYPAAVLVPVMALVMLGCLGYAVVSELNRKRRWAPLSIDAKIVILTSIALWVGGTIFMVVLESRTGGVFAGASAPGRALDAAFMSVNARTAGFTTVDVAALSHATLFLLAGLIFIGGASSSTAGGIKVNTFTTLFFAILASVRGSEHVHAFGREIPQRLVNRALSIALLSVAVVFLLTLATAITTEGPFVDTLFEAVSAFGTDGLSTGLTPTLDAWGRLVITAGMFIGRLGPLTITFALAGRAARSRYRYPEEDVSLG